MKALIHYGNSSVTFSFEAGTSVKDLLTSSGVQFAFPCGGKGNCGKCKVIIKAEKIDLPDLYEEKRTDDERRRCIYPACKTRLFSDAEIYTGDMREIEGIASPEEKRIPENPFTGKTECVVSAVDIGTTTVAVSAFEMPSGIRIGRSLCRANPQIAHGADVVSRIEFASVNDGLSVLRNEIHGCIELMYRELGITPDFSVVTGNTSMLHFYRGFDASGLATYPFTPQTLFGEIYDGEVYIPPCISAFVGADTVCAVADTGMLDDYCSVLVDIGTNGEIVLNKNGRLYVCSTSAGPVFEGGNISCGVACSPGAITEVFFDKGKLRYSTYSGENPIGITGTGVIDAVSAMIACGAVDENGYIGQPFAVSDSGFYLTQDDVHAVQLAKAAIRAAIDTLLKESKTEVSEIEKLYFAGGFGSFLNARNAALIGLIPAPLIKKVRVCGNAALGGAEMLLFNRSCLQRVASAVKTASVVELSLNPAFAESFLECTKFEI